MTTTTLSITDEQVHHIFDIFDADGSGFVEVDELGLAFQAVGLGVLPKTTVDSLVRDACPQGTVQVNRHEFLRMVRSQLTERNSVEEAVRNFGLVLSAVSASPDGGLPEGKLLVTVDDLLAVARQTGEIPKNDAAAEAAYRRVFEDVLAAHGTDEGIPLATWVKVMRESVSDKRHRVRDTSSYSIKTKAVIAKRGPYGTRVEEGKVYFICTCGMSKNQPFCDGSHNAFNIANGTLFEPIVYTAEETKTVWFCGCKRSNTLPFCDGTHATLPPADL